MTQIEYKNISAISVNVFFGDGGWKYLNSHSCFFNGARVIDGVIRRCNADKTPFALGVQYPTGKIIEVFPSGEDTIVLKPYEDRREWLSRQQSQEKSS